jgi:hypothetical protein
MADYKLVAGELRIGEELLLRGVCSTLQLQPTQHGALLRVAAEPASRHRIKLGTSAAVRRYLACRREQPFWMKPSTHQDLARVPVDTQFLLVELTSSAFALVVPLVDCPSKATLEGSADGLQLVLDTGDPNVLTPGGLALYVACGADPYVLCQQAAGDLASNMPNIKLRRDKRPRTSSSSSAGVPGTRFITRSPTSS